MKSSDLIQEKLEMLLANDLNQVFHNFLGI